MRAMQALTAAAQGRGLTAILSTAETPRALRLEGDADVVIVLWASEEGQRVQVVAPTPLAASDIYGAALTLAPQGGQVTVTLTEAQGPVYLRYAKPATPDDGGVPAGDGGSGGDGGATGDGGGPTLDGGAPAGDGPTAAGDGPGGAADAAGGADRAVASGCGCHAIGGRSSAALALLILLALASRRRPRR